VVGTLAAVGRHRFAPGDVATIRDARDRTRAGTTAPAAGLCLLRVDYRGADAPRDPDP
jgi:tRNA pseudouridine38-40 synthase